MCGRRGETREGSEIQKSKDLGKSYWKEVFQVIICQLLDFDLARSSLPYGQGGGALRAIRWARSRWPVKLAKYYPRLKARTDFQNLEVLRLRVELSFQIPPKSLPKTLSSTLKGRT